jgi:hypothetical protein
MLEGVATYRGSTRDRTSFRTYIDYDTHNSYVSSSDE